MKRSCFPRWSVLLITLLTFSPLNIPILSQNYLAPTRSGVNIVYEKLQVGSVYSASASVDENRQNGYAGFSLDHNWPHLNKELTTALFGGSYGIDGVILHGMHTSSLSLDALAEQLSLNVNTDYKVVSEESKYKFPVAVGEKIDFQMTVLKIDDAGIATVEIIGKNSADKVVLKQTVKLAESGGTSTELEAAVASKEPPSSSYLSEVYPSLEPFKREAPPVYLQGKNLSFQWNNDRAIADLRALFSDSKFSDVKLAKAITTYVAAKMFPSNLFAISRITEIDQDISLEGPFTIEAEVESFGKEGKQRGRSLTRLKVKDKEGALLFQAEIGMSAFTYTRDELKALSRSRDPETNLASIIRGKNQFELEMIFDAILKADISGVEFIDEYHKAIAEDPGKTLDAAKALLAEKELKVAVVGVGGIGGGVAEALGQIPGVKLTVITRSDAGATRLREKFANAGITEYEEVRLRPAATVFEPLKEVIDSLYLRIDAFRRLSESLPTLKSMMELIRGKANERELNTESYVKAVFEAKEKMEGLDVLFIGTGKTDNKDTLLPRKWETPEDIVKHLKVSGDITNVNQRYVEAAFTAAAANRANKIFVVGSVHGKHMGNAFVAAYSRSKASNARLAETWPLAGAADPESMGISLEGDYILSRMTAGVAMAVLRGTKLGFFMTPKQVAEAATWLIAYHHHEELGYMAKHRKKEGVMIPDTSTAVASGAHQVAVPGDASVALIKAKTAPTKKLTPKSAPKIETQLSGGLSAAALVGAAI